MNLSAIVPVKSFAQAKTRLELDPDRKRALCEIMLREVLQTLSSSNRIDEVVVVSGDEEAGGIAKEFGAVRIEQGRDSGVNSAVSLADRYLLEAGHKASVVVPQDIPFIKTQDIDFLLGFQDPPRFSLVVPSRRFDGTNALVRMPVDLMETHYDEDSYRIHLKAGREKTANTSLVFVRRMMMDIDSIDDLRFAIGSNEKPSLCRQLLEMLEQAPETGRPADPSSR